ncbi:MAG TPA: site-2 protease family protein [Gemmataceae bacterium]|nr:site-2 protease family protein [Gemmataceae bacterium]
MNAPLAGDSKSGPWTFLVMAVAVVAGIYYLSVEYGPHVPWQIGKAAIGLGLVIFLHELGHFAVAKWCDVHVEAFSLGFGPAIPGLSYRKGETLYKIAWIPLGGYVKMVGEGSENEEDDDNPRSFKNKTVGQRMAIISAGVVMNVILGAVCFVLAFHGGIKQDPAVIDAIEPGSPAWNHGVQTGQVIEHIGDVDHPYFKDLKFEVMLSREGQQLRMDVASPGSEEQPRSFLITPRRDANDSNPVIGVAPPYALQLATKRHLPRNMPAVYGPAGAARELELKPGDVVVAAGDPQDPEELTPIRDEAGAERTNYWELCRRFLRFNGKPSAIKVRRAGDRSDEPEKLVLGDCGFQHGDFIVGTTDARQTGGYDPFKTAQLDEDPRNPGHPDYFDFSRRMQLLAGYPAVLLVRRQGAPESAPPVPVLVPPAFHQGIPGARMQVGRVKSVRSGSAADSAGVQPGDRIRGILLTDGKQALCVGSKPSAEKLPDGAVERPLDPVRLPFDLRQWAKNRANVQATFVVSRDKQHEDGASQALRPASWDDSWRFNREAPLALAAPLSIPELGVAYQVEPLVAEVDKGSVADRAELQAGDVILAVAFKDLDYENGEKWTKEIELYEKKNEPEPWWARVAWAFQDPNVTEVKLKVLRGTKEGDISWVLRQDLTWPLAERGLRLEHDKRLQKADGPGQAVTLGLHETYQIIVKNYKSLQSMLPRPIGTGRVSVTKNLRGPISIGLAAFNIAGESFPDFMFFLGLISVSVAVINFLPIPVLDGGHMVFLIYEKLRGQPATEQVRLALTYVGVLLILSLMVFVLFLDVKGIWFSG